MLGLTLLLSAAAWPADAAVQAAKVEHADAAEKADHGHLSLVLAPSQALATGDSMGLYAVELLACPGDGAARQPVTWRQTTAPWAWLDRLTDMLFSSAHANHRDRFDRPGPRIVALRVPLDRAG